MFAPVDTDRVVETPFSAGYEFGKNWRSPAVVIGSELDAGVISAAPAARKRSIHSIFIGANTNVIALPRGSTKPENVWL